MAKSAIRDRLIDEIKLIPEHRLSEIYDFIHYFRVGLQKSKGNIDQIMKFAGCWKDMPEDVFTDFIREVTQLSAALKKGRKWLAKSGAGGFDRMVE